MGGCIRQTFSVCEREIDFMQTNADLSYVKGNMGGAVVTGVNCACRQGAAAIAIANTPSKGKVQHFLSRFKFACDSENKHRGAAEDTGLRGTENLQTENSTPTPSPTPTSTFVAVVVGVAAIAITITLTITIRGRSRARDGAGGGDGGGAG